MKKLPIKLTVLILTSILLYTVTSLSVYASDDIRKKITGITYSEYRENLSEQTVTGSEVKIDAVSYVNTDMKVEKHDRLEGSDGNVIVTQEEGTIEWEVNIPESALYNIKVKYLPIKGKGSSIERTLFIDGQVPFSQARNITFTRVWQDADAIKQDSRGNDMRPRQEESPEWREVPVRDSFGYYSEPFLFYLEKGVHKIGFQSVREPMAIEWIKLYKEERVPTYDEVLASYKNQGFTPAKAKDVKIQAEDTQKKSDMSIYPIYDRSSAATEPQDVTKIKLNTLGREKWQMPGQWVTWKFTVPESGLYKIAPRFRQNIYAGSYVTRKVLLNGKVPFKEAEKVRFTYKDSWQLKALGDDTREFEFYFDEGEHELCMEVVLGDLSEILRTVEDSMYSLNEIYRKLLMIIGAVPDNYRDYDFDILVPEVLQEMKNQSEILFRISKSLEEYTGEKGEHVVLLDKIAFQLEEMWRKPEYIAPKFINFKGNIGALGTWILNTRQQPLELDYILVVPADRKLPKAEAGFFTSMLFEIRSFLMSFFEDYNSIGAVYTQEEMKKDDILSVWIATGRDQAQVIKQMVDDTFTPATNVKVSLELVAPGTLLPSTLAGIGPDVALSNLATDPVNFAIRSAVHDVSKFVDFKEVSARFHPSALVPYEFNKGTFALPETQTFPMFFYRTDIFTELGLTVPKTWDDFYKIIPELQKRNMEIAYPPGMVGMQVFLYQMGGEMYKGNGARTNLDSEVAVEAYKRMCDLYTVYKFPVIYDFANRFRIGEMPAGIVDFTLYNHLTVFAPEIRGLWEFVPLPGVKGEDGKINNATPSAGTAVMMMNNAKNKENAWEFMKWWTSAETQGRFGVEMESLLGPSAKHPTANMEALKQMPWPAKDYRNLMEQWKTAVGTPEVPGGYYTPRNVEFAFKRVYNNGDDAAETLLDYIDEINEEIIRKRTEFGLE